MVERKPDISIISRNLIGLTNLLRGKKKKQFSDLLAKKNVAIHNVNT